MVEKLETNQEELTELNWFKKELNELEWDIKDNMKKLEKKIDAKRNKENKTLFFCYNIDQNDWWKKRDMELYIKDNWDNVKLIIDVYNTFWKNPDKQDVIKTFKKSEIDKIPSYITNVLSGKWITFSTKSGKENLKLTELSLLNKIEEKAENAVKLFEYYSKEK